MVQEPDDYRGTADRRSGRDRRQSRFPTLAGLFLQRRRGDRRRRSDRNRIVILDRYINTNLWPVVLVLLLSITDGFLTLFLLTNGAMELNPVMNFFIDIGPFAFMGAKYLFTVGSVLIVVVLNDALVRYFKIYARELVKYFAAAFGAVVGWEIYLVFGYLL
jgi:hypothetical protein